MRGLSGFPIPPAMALRVSYGAFDCRARMRRSSHVLDYPHIGYVLTYVNIDPGYEIQGAIKVYAAFFLTWREKIPDKEIQDKEAGAANPGPVQVYRIP